VFDRFAYGGFDLKLEQIFAADPAASQKVRGQNWLKKNHLDTLFLIRETHCMI
jgi:hypothetical protein